MIRRRHPALAGLVVASLLALLPIRRPLLAQGARDSLVQGRRAYERADLNTAIRLLQVGVAAGGARDTLWVGGAHMLTDALLEQGKDSIATLWARWVLRVAPAIAIDSISYPPRVAQALLRARAVTQSTGGVIDSSALTVLEAAGDPASGRGGLRLVRANVSALAVVESVGTMLPGESRNLPMGTYQLRISADGYPMLNVAREVLPGFTTVVTPRLSHTPQATTGTTTTTGTTATVTAGPVAAAAIRSVTFDAAGGTTCALLDGLARCWGENHDGQLGSGFADSSHTPTRVVGGQMFGSISVGPTHACGLTALGIAYCWGNGTSGELGNGRAASSLTPVAVVGVPQFVAIGAGAAHSCGLTAAGAVHCWGSDAHGQLGNRGTAPSPSAVPVQAPAGVAFATLAVGPNHSCAITAAGALYCWGANALSQIGNGSSNDAEVPVQVEGPGPFKAVAPGASHTCALTLAGAAWCWGSNANGQLGQGPTGPAGSPRPVSVTDGLSFVAIAAGESHTCALTPDGAAYCWGAGRSGQLGNGQQSDSPRPALVVGGQMFRAIGLGTAHSCAFAADNVAWCWGDNSAGQLGTIAGRSSAVPIAVLVRPAPRYIAAAPVLRSLKETFDDGNFTANPAWLPDSAPGVSLLVLDRSFEIARSRTGRLGGVGGGLTLPVRLPVTRQTQLQFDVMVLADTARTGCGLNCATWPAAVRVRVKNTDLTESEVWYVYGDKGGRGRSFGNVVIVAKGDATPGRWLRAERFTIKDALPRADSILQISIGSIGADAGARFDNLFIPVPVPATIVLTPDAAELAAGGHAQLRAAVFDTAGVSTPWIRVAWTSSDTSVARVDSLGMVTAVGGGRAIVRASAGAIRDSAQITVSAPGTPPSPAPRRPPRRPRQ